MLRLSGSRLTRVAVSALALALPLTIAGCIEDSDALEDEAVVESIPLATFRLDNGNVVEFLRTADGELVVGETSNGKGGSATLVFDPTATLDALERYLLVAPAEVPVPDALAKLDDGRGLIAGRATVPALDAPIDTNAPTYASPWDVDVFAACTYASTFYQQVCQASDSSPNAFWFCDKAYGSTGNTKWATLVRSSTGPRWGSADKKTKSVSWTLSCDTSVRVRHRVLFDNSWATVLDRTQGSYRISSWFVQGSDVHRSVRHERTQSQSGLRALTYFL